MYRFIDTVSIDVMSIARYHFDREPREERSVDGSEAREVRLKRCDSASRGLRRFARESILRRLTLIATIWPVRYSSGDARHQTSKEPGERQLRPFRRSRVYLHVHHRGFYGGWVPARPAFGDAALVVAGGAPRRVWGGALLSVRNPQQGGTRVSAHWRLAVGGAAATAVMSLGAAAVVGYYFGAVYAGAFLYGAGVGLVSFTSIAITAWLLGGKLSGEKVLLGVAVYFGRLMLVAVAVGAPIFLASWPAPALIGGFAGVYVVENVLLLIGAAKGRGAYGRGAGGGDRNGG